MANNNIGTLQAASVELGIAYQSLNKIVAGPRFPTIEQCIILCEKGGYSANWLLLDMGEMQIGTQESLNSIAKAIRSLRSKINLSTP